MVPGFYTYMFEQRMISGWCVCGLYDKYGRFVCVYEKRMISMGGVKCKVGVGKVPALLNILLTPTLANLL